MDESVVTVFIVAFFIFGVAFFNSPALLNSRGSSGSFGTRLLAFWRPRQAPTPQRRPLGLTPRRRSDRAAR